MNKSYYLRYLESILWLIFGLAVIKSMYFLCKILQFIIVYPATTTRPESFVLNGSLRYAMGLPIYIKPGSFPYITNVYNPFAYLPAGIIGRAFSSNVTLVMKSGKLLSYVSSLLLVGVGALVVWESVKSLKAVIFSCVGIIYFHLVTLSESFRIRPEPEGMLFSLSGVLVMLGKGKHRIYIGAMLFMIAFMFKQSFIAAPISVFFYLLIKKEYRELIRFSMAMSIMLALFFLVMSVLTDGNYYLCAIKAMAVNNMVLWDNLRIVIPYLLIYLWPVLLSLLLCVYLYPMLEERVTLVFVYFVTSLIWAIVSFSKDGAAVNYFSEFVIISLIVIGIFIGHMSISEKYPHSFVRWLPIALFAVYIGVDVASNGVWEFVVPLPEDGTVDISQYVNRYQEVAGEKLVFHERIAVHLGNPVGLDWYLLGILSNHNMIDMAPLSKKIADGEYQLIVFSKQFITPIERQFLTEVQNGPYKERFEDEYVMEYERVLSGGQQ